MTSRISHLAAALVGTAVLGCGDGSQPSRSNGKSDPVAIDIVLADDGAIEVSGFDGPTVRRLESGQIDDATWARLLTVRVGEDADLPAVQGTRTFESGRVRFVPAFPLRPGLEYAVTWEGSALAELERPLRARATVGLPAPVLERMTVVEHVDPAGDVLPENLLRFYVHFSAPMNRGKSYEHVRLLNAAGDVVEDAFLELGEELWDADGTRFTLFFDPGRVKRELVPRAELGPALVAGESYTLVVSADWQDARGARLEREYRRTFRAGPMKTTRPDPDAWTIDAPQAESTAALTVDFGESLDRAMSDRMIHVEDAKGERVAGSVVVDPDGHRWQWQTDDEWRAGTYALVVDTRLEDVAGNSVGQPFEIPLDGKPQPTGAEFVRRTFEVTSP